MTIPRDGPDSGLADASVPRDATQHDSRAAHDDATADTRTPPADAGVDRIAPPGDAGADRGAPPGDAGADRVAPPGDAGKDVVVDAAVDSDAGDGSVVGPIAMVSAGDLFSCALTVAGSVWCWGSNDMAELGAMPSPADESCGRGHCSAVPVRIPTIDDATEISLGIEFGCAIRADRSVWCWGKNDLGELGHEPDAGGDGTCSTAVGDAGSTPSPCNPLPQKIALPSGVLAAHVSVGWAVACVDTQDVPLGDGAYEGDVYCWGNNDHDTVGLPGSAGSVIPIPNKVSVFESDVVDLAVAGDLRYACAVRHDGSVWCWGDDYQGRLGALEGSGLTGPDEDGYDHPTPVQVHVETQVDAGADAGDVGLGAPLTNVKAIAIGDASSCALKFDGTVWCWGSDAAGGLGDEGPFNGAQHPGARQLLGLPTNIAAIEHHSSGAFAVDGTGSVFGWGDDTFRELGETSPVTPCVVEAPEDDALCTSPPVALAALVGASSLATGEYSALMVTNASQVSAWGLNDHAQLGHAPGTQGDVVCTGYSETAACNATPTRVPLP